MLIKWERVFHGEYVYLILILLRMIRIKSFAALNGNLKYIPYMNNSYLNFKYFIFYKLSKPLTYRVIMVALMPV